MDQVLTLPKDERFAFAEALVRKLALDPDVLESWYDEAERRSESPVGIPWEQVREGFAGADKRRDR